MINKITKLLFMFMIFTSATFAQTYKYETPEDFWKDVKPIVGPTKVDLGKNAEIDVPEGFLFLTGKDIAKFNAFTGNLTNKLEVGFLIPENMAWFVCFEYEDTGYIKKEEIDADAILKSMQAGDVATNKRRKSQGYPELFTKGWFIKPNFNQVSNNLEWAFLIEDDKQSQVVNYNSRILGRSGVMSATLVMSPEQKDAISVFQGLLTKFEYKKGNTYAEFTQGDKVAEYGMAALITGGAIAVAAKSGLLQKFWKLIAVGAVVVAGAVRKFWKKMIGKE